MDSKAASQLICTLCLICICVLSFTVRLFSVIKYESVIHEFDPYFNYRVTQYFTQEGFYNTWNYFDDKTWYPLGRVIGGTMYPGLIFTAGLIHKILHTLNIPLHVQEVCVFTAPLFSSLCSLAGYLFVNEVKGQGAGLLAAAFVGLVPSYISRSVAGSYDLEAVAIFALLLVFFLFVKTLNTGSLMWATGLAGAYFYMVASWGGYSFIINLLPIYCLGAIFLGRLTPRLYIAYAPFIVFGCMLAASIPVVGFNSVLMSEHFGSYFAFVILHIAVVLQYTKELLISKEKIYKSAQALVLTVAAFAMIALGFIVITYVLASPTFGWTGRSLSLLDPTYASKYIPIIASVSEHQPPQWNSYVTDLHILVLFVPAGIIACFLPLTDASLFLILYGITAAYFSGVMVRLMLVLAPSACCLGACAVSALLKTLSKGFWGGAEEYQAPPPEQKSKVVEEPAQPSKQHGKDKKKPPPKKPEAKKPAKDDKYLGYFDRFPKHPIPTEVSGISIIFLLFLLAFYVVHCVWVSAEMYSAPSIVLQTRGRDGGVYVFDDFREAYSWISHNTDENCKVVSWWDYGYQTTAMANRTVLVDNNTWNNTHIATVGRAMSSNEKKAWEIYRSLDVDYVFVVFGGLIGYPSDDINKFLWMVRIGGGVYPEIREQDYLGPQGYRIDASASKTMLDSLMYKLSYYRFKEGALQRVGREGFDRVRNVVIGDMDVTLKYFEEVFTSEHWMVRVYRVLPEPNREVKSNSPLAQWAAPSRSKRKLRLPSGAAKPMK